MAEIYDLDAIYAEVRAEPFRFRWSGRDWELPNFGDIDLRAAGLVAQIETLADEDNKTGTIELLSKVFEYSFGEEQAALWAKTAQNVSALMKLFEAWQKHSGTSVGEPSASTGSSPSTGRPSKRTLPATTGSGSRGRSTARRKSA